MPFFHWVTSTYGSGVYIGFEGWRMYWVEWKTRKASPARKSREDRRPATGRRRKPVQSGKEDKKNQLKNMWKISYKKFRKRLLTRLNICNTFSINWTDLFIFYILVAILLTKHYMLKQWWLWRLIKIKIKKIEQKEIQKCSSSQKPLTDSRSCTFLKEKPTGTTGKLCLSSPSIVAPNGPM